MFHPFVIREIPDPDKKESGENGQKFFQAVFVDTITIKINSGSLANLISDSYNLMQEQLWLSCPELCLRQQHKN